MKKALLCVTALCLSVLLCSCWDYTELNLRHIATGLALDQGKEQTYLMTVELMTFEGEKASSRLLQAEADTAQADADTKAAEAEAAVDAAEAQSDAPEADQDAEPPCEG